jgi:hypothetical protein
MTISLTQAKKIAANPSAYTMEELDDALTAVLDSDRLSETQCSNLTAKIEAGMKAQLTPKPYIPVEHRALSANDLYDLNRIINKLNDSGHSQMGAKLIEVRDYGECQIKDWLNY